MRGQMTSPFSHACSAAAPRRQNVPSRHSRLFRRDVVPAAMLGIALLFKCTDAPGPDPDVVGPGGPDPNPNRPVVMVVSISAEPDYRDPVADTQVYRPCDVIQAYVAGSPVPLVERILLDGRDIPFVIDADEDGIGLKAVMEPDSGMSNTGEKHLSIVTSGGTASGRVNVPATAVTFRRPYELPQMPQNVLIARGRADYYEIGAWFTFENNLMNFDIEDTIVKDTLFTIPAAWFDTVRSDQIKFFIVGVNGAMPVSGESGNMTGSALGFLLARNMMADPIPLTITTRSMVSSPVASTGIGKIMAATAIPIQEKTLALRVWNRGRL